MAWGVWNKIKKGFQKVGRAIVKGAKWVNDKIIKPFKPVVKTIAGTVDTVSGSPSPLKSSSSARKPLLFTQIVADLRDYAAGIF